MTRIILGVQISGNFAPGYPELFFERVPGTRIFVMFPKITLKRASQHSGSGTCWHTSMNSLDLLCSTFEQCRINLRKSQTYRINFENPSIYDVAYMKFKNIFTTIDYTIFVDDEINKILLHAKIFRKDLYFRKGKSRNDRLMWRGSERAKATTKHIRQLGKLVIQ